MTDRQMVTRLWAQHGGQDISDFVRAMSAGTGPFADKAKKIVDDKDGWRSAGEAAGWKEIAKVGPSMLDIWPSAGPNWGVTALVFADANGNRAEHKDWKALCEAEGISETKQAVEHRVVSAWLMEKLRAAGECVSAELPEIFVWARTSNGPIDQDDVLVQIAQDLEIIPSP